MTPFQNLATSALFAGCTIIICTYTLSLAIYRLLLSPLRKIPGPKIAALTGWYETYLDVFKGGQFEFEIERMHHKYGPIVRITPWEVHIHDPEFYDVLFNAKSHFDKIESLRFRFGLPLSSFDTIQHNHHRMRRDAIAPYFSRQKVNNFAPEIQRLATKLCDRLTSEYANTSRVINLNEAYAAFVSDAITYYTFAFSYDFLDFPDFITPFTTSIRKLAMSLHTAGHFPWILTLLQSVPDNIVGLLNPMMKPVFEFHGEVKNQVLKVMNGENDGHKHVSHKTVFNELLKSNLAPEELSVERLKHEAASITGAGIDTTKTTMALISFYVLNNSEICTTLQKELEAAIADPSNIPGVPDLERLPYLSAVIQEGLRMAYGISQRLSRINPNGSIQYNQHLIPAGYRFSMSTYMMHRDESIFPDPGTFRPERWLGKPTAKSGKPLARYLVPFGRGPRMCLGINFANAELYIGLATIFRRLKLELFETERDAVDMDADFFVPVPKPDTKGVRVTVKSALAVE
ncbi:hypothetical protein NHQ30_008473 [Ciborinia camelliae]|nr:hypothetical protein NHQ30_008473 [Ciborinia camelliae]